LRRALPALSRSFAHISHNMPSSLRLRHHPSRSCLDFFLSLFLFLGQDYLSFFFSRSESFRAACLASLRLRFFFSLFSFLLLLVSLIYTTASPQRFLTAATVISTRPPYTIFPFPAERRLFPNSARHAGAPWSFF